MQDKLNNSSLETEQEVIVENSPNTQSNEQVTAVTYRTIFKNKKGNRPSSRSVFISLLRSIPFFNKLLMNVNGLGSSINGLVNIVDREAVVIENAGQTFDIIRLVTNIIDFIRIPCLYLASFLLGEKPPITLSNNGRFVYATIMLVLGITALCVPSSALIIGLVMSIVACGMSMFTLTKLHYSKYDVEDNLERVKKEIEREKNELEALIENLEKLELETQEKILMQNEEIGKLQEAINIKLERYQGLLDEQEHWVAKLARFGKLEILDRQLGVGLAVLGVIGSVIGFFVPVVALSIFISLSVIGFGYLVGRIVQHVSSQKGQEMKDFAGEKVDLDAESDEKPTPNPYCKLGNPVSKSVEQQVSNDILNTPCPLNHNNCNTTDTFNPDLITSTNKM